MAGNMLLDVHPFLFSSLIGTVVSGNLSSPNLLYCLGGGLGSQPSHGAAAVSIRVEVSAASMQSLTLLGPTSVLTPEMGLANKDFEKISVLLINRLV